MWQRVIFPLQEAAAPSDSTYELCYNHACYLIGAGKYKEAEDKLKEAESKRLYIYIISFICSVNPTRRHYIYDHFKLYFCVRSQFVCLARKLNGHSQCIYKVLNH